LTKPLSLFFPSFHPDILPIFPQFIWQDGSAASTACQELSELTIVVATVRLLARNRHTALVPQKVFMAANIDYSIDGRQCEPSPSGASKANVQKSLVVAGELLEYKLQDVL
jgi:hypothetical protein